MKQLQGVPFQFSETMAGNVTEKSPQIKNLPSAVTKGSKDIRVDITILINDLCEFLENPDHCGRVVGTLTLDGQKSEIQDGKFSLFNKDELNVRHLEYAFRFMNENGPYKFLGIKNIKNGPGLDMLNDLTTLFVNVEGPDAKPWAGDMRFKVSDFVSLVASMQAPEGLPQATRILAKTAFLSFCFGQPIDEYFLKKIGI